jgi:hypothetical protein
VEYPHEQEAFNNSVNSVGQKLFVRNTLDSGIEEYGAKKAVEYVKRQNPLLFLFMLSQKEKRQNANLQ